MEGNWPFSYWPIGQFTLNTLRTFIIGTDVSYYLPDIVETAPGCWWQVSYRKEEQVCTLGRWDLCSSPSAATSVPWS